MRHGYDQSPINPLPAVVWALVLPMIASEAVFALGQYGLAGGTGGMAMRVTMLRETAYAPEILIRMWQYGAALPTELARLFSYSFIHAGLMQAVFVIAFTLALGKMVAEQFRPWAVLALFFGSAIGGAIIYTIFALIYPGPVGPLMGGYPAVYGLVGAFTFLIWTRLGQQNANQFRAFSLIGMLLLFQLVFGLLFGGAGFGWIAEISGFVTGFLLSFLVVPGGVSRVLTALRQR